MEQQILQLLREICGKPDLTPAQELLETGLLDSLAFMTLLTELDLRLGVELQPTQIAREHWRTPASIAALVQTLLQQ